MVIVNLRLDSMAILLHVPDPFSKASRVMGWNDFSLSVVGCTYDNEDGSSRQLELAECRPGDPVDLTREPQNPHDPLAVAIVTASGTRVGYLSRDRACWIAPKIDRGYPVNAIVERVKGIHLPGALLGLVVRINMDGERPDLPSGAHTSIVIPEISCKTSYSQNNYLG